MTQYITTINLLGNDGPTPKGSVVELDEQAESTQKMLAKGLIQLYTGPAPSPTEAPKFPQVGQTVKVVDPTGPLHGQSGTFLGFAVEIEGQEDHILLPESGMFETVAKIPAIGQESAAKPFYQMNKTELREYATGLKISFPEDISHTDLKALVKAAL